MKTKFVFLSLLCTSAAFTSPLEIDHSQFKSSSIEDSYRYVGVGIGPLILPFPNANIGTRVQKNHFGFDAGLGLASIGVVTHLKGFANLLLFPNPSKEGQFYLGAGAVGGPWFYDDDFGIAYDKVLMTGAANLVLGHDFVTNEGKKSFFQVDIAYPSYIEEINYKMPFVTFSYGWGF